MKSLLGKIAYSFEAKPWLRRLGWTCWFGLVALLSVALLNTVLLSSTPVGSSPSFSSSSAPSLEPFAEEERGDNPERRRKWFLFQRTYPFDSMPPNGRRDAWNAIQGRGLSTFATAAAIDTWEPIGPHSTISAFPGNWGNTSGRINSIAVSPADPQIILIGASTGGVWRSTDGGNTFGPVSDNHVDLTVGSVAFSQSNPSIAYAGMGDEGNLFLGSGVLKTTDSGASWTRVSNSTLPSPGATTRIAVDPNNPNRVYLAQFAVLSGPSLFSSGFWVSNDGGVSWTRTFRGLPSDVVIDPLNSQRLFLGMTRVDEPGGLPAGIYRSTDSGQTWASAFPTPFTSTSDVKLSATTISGGLIYGFIGGNAGAGINLRVMVSNDAGATWTNKGANNIDPGQFSYNSYIAADPNQPDTIYVGTRDVYKSTDGGTSWTNLSGNFQLANNFQFTPRSSTTHPDQHGFAFLPDNGSILVANDGGISGSTDGGATFRSLNSTLSLTQFYSIALHPTDSSITYGGTQDNGSQRRNTASSVWREIISGDGGNCVINQPLPSTVFTTFVNGTVFRFINNGLQFDRQVAQNSSFGEPSSSPRIAFIAPFIGSEVDSTLYFGTWRLFISSDLGESWSPPGGSTDLTRGGTDVLSTIAVARSNESVIYTGSSRGRVMTSTNGGTSWTEINNGLPNRFISYIVVNRTDPSISYLAVSGFGTSHIFKTVNGGATWTPSDTGVPDIPVNALMIDLADSNILYAGSDIGVFRSLDAGATWSPYNAGLPPVVVQAFSANASGLIHVATYGRGAYELDTGRVIQVPNITAAVFTTKKLLTITGERFTGSPRVFINGTDRTSKIQTTSDSTITLKGKAKKLGFKSGENQIRIVNIAGGSNIFIVNQ